MFQNFQMNGTSEVNLKIFFYDIFYGILLWKLFCQTMRKNIVKLGHYEKATKLEKNLPLVLTKQLCLLSSIKTSGTFFQIFVAFSEKLNFNEKFLNINVH